MGQQLIDVIIDHNFIKSNPLPTEGTIWFILQPRHTFPTYCMVHRADDDGLFIGAVVVVETDITFVYVAEFLMDWVRALHS